MLTDKQMKKGCEALRRKKSEDLVRQIKLLRYRRDQQTAAAFHLPFRMIHNREYPEGEIPPNWYYPNPCGITIDTDGKWQPVPEKECLTDADMNYWFTRFLTLIDLDEYGDADLTGERIPPATAAAIRDEYRRRIQDYNANPDRFNTRGWRSGDVGGRQYPKIDS